jgi:hypothetical protein
LEKDPKEPKPLIHLKEKLTAPLPAGTFVSINKWHFMLIEEAKEGDSDLVTVILRPPTTNTPTAGASVICTDYNFDVLVNATGKPPTNYMQGSTMISITSAPAELDVKMPESGACIAPNATARITSRGQCPFFTCAAPSRSLQLKDGTIYSMLGDPVTTAANPGIAFESWIKVDQITESVIVAYTSERFARSPVKSEDTSNVSQNEHQTIVLTMKDTNNKQNFELSCNANGTLFLVKDDKTFVGKKWFHFACSLYNVLGLRFSGENYVDFGTSAEWNVQEFSIAFTLELSQVGTEQVLFTKTTDNTANTPIHLKVTSDNRLCLTYWADVEGSTAGKPVERSVTSDGKVFVRHTPYKIFVSRRYVQVPKKDSKPRTAQCVTMIAWDTDDQPLFNLKPPSFTELEADESKIGSSGATQASGAAVMNDSPLSLGGAAWTMKDRKGLKGIIGPVRFYSTAVQLDANPSSKRFCVPNNSENGLIGAWTFQSGEPLVLIDDCGRNNGKLKNSPKGVISPFTPDHRLSVYVDGISKTTNIVAMSTLLSRPAGPHQLTLGNTIHEHESTRFLQLAGGFNGEVSFLLLAMPSDTDK